MTGPKKKLLNEMVIESAPICHKFIDQLVKDILNRYQDNQEKKELIPDLICNALLAELLAFVRDISHNKNDFTESTESAIRIIKNLAPIIWDIKKEPNGQED